MCIKASEIFAENSLNSYNEAMASAESLEVVNPIRLGLALNFSVFYYEIIGDNELLNTNCDPNIIYLELKTPDKHIFSNI